ncbi:stealth family protein [Paraglaciecola sp. L3A3]|uniref:stealth family protein n=1 Tax=Paraglaciecola sp. L3A3 TaxID=2686358 RepID=UPI00131C84CD|nr:stealth family protein [Paraglaciecola sp. L3A3]
MSRFSSRKIITNNSPNDFPIDFVILWVDGSDPEHERKRSKYLADFQLESAENAEQSTDLKRFIQHDELVYCLRSIKQHAPWYRKIYLITDNQIPEFLDENRLGLDRIEIVDHKELFQGKEEFLPTFNTRSLTTMMHHIKGLSEHFIYGNDDFMLGSSVTKSFFYEVERPIIYADWASFEDEDTLTLHLQGMINGAQLVGGDKKRFLISSHGFIPLKKSIMNDLAETYSQEFSKNIRYKFRHESQFLPESLFNHYTIKSGDGILKSTELMVHFSFELCRTGSSEKIEFLLGLIEQGKRKMFCLNEFQSLYVRFPQIKEYLTRICGSALLSEVQSELESRYV